jgi:single-strand binding protein
MRDRNSLNKVILIGHLVKKPEIRYLPESGRPVARFQVATNEQVFYPDTKKTNDRTEYHRIIAWGKLAEFCENTWSRQADSD